MQIILSKLCYVCTVLFTPPLGFSVEQIKIFQVRHKNVNFHFSDFISRNETLTAKLLQQGHR